MATHNIFYELSRGEMPDTGRILKTAAGFLFGWGPTVPADGTGSPGWSPGAIFIHTDGSDGSNIYVNDGTILSADFNLVVITAA